MSRTVEISSYLDKLLEIDRIPDYPNALNGLQLANSGQISRIAACVDFSSRAIDGAIDQKADLLLVHHGMFWGGMKPLRGPAYTRLRQLFLHDIAVYSSHLPLDRHAQFGNNVLLSQTLGLQPSGDFAQFNGTSIGVQGECDIATTELVQRARNFAREQGGESVCTDNSKSRRTYRWAACTGAGASGETLEEAATSGIDTLIVGEGPHWTAVEAVELGIAVIYAGHYATETLGVKALASHLADTFELEWTMIHAPTGL